MCFESACRSSLPKPTLRSEEHTSELQSRPHLVCRLLLEKKKILAEVNRQTLRGDVIHRLDGETHSGLDGAQLYDERRGKERGPVNVRCRKHALHVSHMTNTASSSHSLPTAPYERDRSQTHQR